MNTQSARWRLPSSGRPEPAIWGGLECTINRVGNHFRDQLQETGHYDRAGDVEAFASLGIRALRYPLLWEKMQSAANEAIDWSWADDQLSKITQAGMTPIAGLLHHGSGPAWTDLLNPAFPEQFAAYAGQVAARFPWLEYYTPINEPLTTARFSGLYGHWYPHAKDDHSFVTMLLHQVKGIVLAMQAIRKINPLAVLVQTEDLAKIHSTEVLAFQARFENERRWLTYDLLCGKVTETHALWNWLLSVGIGEATLHFFSDHPCPPGIIGCNYYITSERFLDDRLALYPPAACGGNGKMAYADTECVRVQPPAGLKALVTEVWERYQVPIALTEVHLHCTREEQLRWLAEAWATGCALRKEGVDLTAITAWSLLGSFDWSSLLTRNEQRYEPGVFRLTGGGLKTTALATMVQSLARNGFYHHPLLDAQGWWNAPVPATSIKTLPPLLLLGDENVCRLLEAVCKIRAVACMVAPLTKDSGLTSIGAMCKMHDPWGIVYAVQGRPSLRLVQLLEDACHQSGIPGMHLLPQCFFSNHTAVTGLEIQIMVPGGDEQAYEPGDGLPCAAIPGEGLAAEWLLMLDTALDLFMDRVPGRWKLAPGVTEQLEPAAFLF